MATREVGLIGENIARGYLEKKGYKFVTANWACKTGEIDLIMKLNDVLVMIEVRMRRPTTFGEGADTVAREKQRKLILAAKYYQQKEDYWDDIQFDVVSIEWDGEGEPKIDHIESAFEEI